MTLHHGRSRTAVSRPLAGLSMLTLLATLALALAPAADAAAPKVTAIDAGDYHTCAVTSDGQAWCWGQNPNGGLGDGSIIERNRPVKVRQDAGGLLGGIKSISAGSLHSCAKTTAKAAACWGADGDYGTPDGTERHAAVPAFTDLGPIKSIGTGAFHSCALLVAGTVWCSGANWYGSLGNGTEQPSADAVQVQTSTGFLTGVRALSVGSFFNCAVRTAGDVWCWGQNENGSLGDGTTSNRATAVRVRQGQGFLGGVRTVGQSVGHHVCAVKTDGSVWCWGANGVGQIGDGGQTERHTATRVRLGHGYLGGVRSVATGFAHSCAVRNDSTLWCWGWNAIGELGDGTLHDRYEPVRVHLGHGYLGGVRAVTAGAAHTCAITNAGVAWCWGTGWAGQLGDGSTAQSRTLPVQVRFPG
jgi:alpha-tubulin suppressor-like RCC1 family protein